MGDIFREIDEELRQEKAEKIWRAYGKYVIGGAVAIVLAVAGYNGWQQYDRGQRLEAGAKFATAKALIAENKPADAAALFAALARESGTAYGMLARFHEAALLIETGDKPAAAAAFRALSKDDSLDRPMRELAAILAAVNGADSGGGEIAAELAPLAEEASPWRHTALEVLGLIARREGRLDEAKAYFRRIVDDVEAPTNVRARATQMLSMLANQ